MCALLVHLGLEGVTIGADVLDLVDSGWYRTVISMTGGAGGRAQVAAHCHRVVVDAGGIVCELIGGYPVLLHVGGVGVAA